MGIPQTRVEGAQGTCKKGAPAEVFGHVLSPEYPRGHIVMEVKPSLGDGTMT
jgi:hypothetical protein